MIRRLFILLLTSVAVAAGAQSLSLSSDDGHLLNNDTIILWGSDSLIETKVYVTNASDTDRLVMLKKTELVMVAGTYNYFCWGVCYPQGNESTSPVLIPAGTTDFLNFVCHYFYQGNPGTSIIRYTFYTIDNINDSVCINVTYNAFTGVGIAGLDVTTKISAPYPNPATGFFNLSYNLCSETDAHYTAVIQNLQGSVMQQELLNAVKGSQRIDVTGLSAGMYFCTIMCRGEAVYTWKLIIE